MGMTNERLYGHGDAIVVTGLDSRTLTKWQQRGTIGNVGEMQPSGRRHYSFADLVKLSIIREIVTVIGVQPATAAGMADLVLGEIENAPRQLIRNGQRTDERRVALFAFDEGAWGYDVLTIDELIEQLRNGAELRAQALIPLDDIIIRTGAKVAELQEAEAS
jgi:DNA-binding transcriptional MerR regulator